jgi:hypothetical protein
MAQAVRLDPASPARWFDGWKPIQGNSCVLPSAGDHNARNRGDAEKAEFRVERRRQLPVVGRSRCADGVSPERLVFVPPVLTAKNIESIDATYRR